MATPPGFYNPVDQAIYSAGDFFIPQERFRAAPYNVNTPAADDPAAAGLPAVYKPQGGGGGGAYTGGIDDLIQNYELDTRDQYFGSMPTPLVDDLYQSKVDKTFMGFPSYRQQELTGPDMGEYIGSGTDVPLELTTAGRIQDSLGNIKEGIGSFADKIGGFGPISMVLGAMDKFDTLPAIDQEFIKRNMGYRGPTVFGENTSGLNKDPFGINTRSAFGNYAEFVGEEAKKLGDTLKATGKVGSKFAGATFNPETGMFELDDGSKLTPKQLADINKRTNMLRQRYQFYTQKEKERMDMIEQERKRQEAAFQAQLNQQQRDQRQSDLNRIDRAYREETGGQGGSYATGESGVQSDGSYNDPFDPGGGEKDGGFIDGTNRRMDFMVGGLADLVDIYD